MTSRLLPKKDDSNEKEKDNRSKAVGMTIFQNNAFFFMPFSWIPWNLSFRYIHCSGQFTSKMKANAEPRLLSSLVWIDQYNECNGKTSFMEFMKSAYTNKCCCYSVTLWLQTQYSNPMPPRVVLVPRSIKRFFNTAAYPLILKATLKICWHTYVWSWQV